MDSKQKDRLPVRPDEAALIEALKAQKIAGGDPALARELAAAGELVEVKKAARIIEQGGHDTDVYLIVAGALDIVVNGKTVGTRIAGDHVGEMAAMQPEQRRSATIAAREDSLLLKIAGPRIAGLGERYPRIWRVFAHELTHRLRQRNDRVSAVNDKVRVFAICSAETRHFAEELRSQFAGEPFELAIWGEGAFRASHYAVESLEQELDRCDAALAIFDGDGARGATHDDLIFELGFLMGRLGRHRVALLERAGEELKTPCRLGGMTTILFKDGEGGLASAAARLKQLIRDLGPNR